MERQLPKNVRQIGNVSDNPKIYVEDYVDTYLNQLREKAKEQPVGVILVGEVLELEDEKAVFVSGAVQMQELSEKDGKRTRWNETYDGRSSAVFSGKSYCRMGNC